MCGELCKLENLGWHLHSSFHIVLRKMDLNPLLASSIKLFICGGFGEILRCMWRVCEQVTKVWCKVAAACETVAVNGNVKSSCRS